MNLNSSNFLISKSSWRKFSILAIKSLKSSFTSFSLLFSAFRSLIEESVAHLENVRVEIGAGLTVDFAQKVGCKMLVRGIRAVMDYDAEMQQATANRSLNDEIETVFLVASPKYSFVSSSLARTIASYHGNLDPFVPKNVKVALQAKYKE